jgi:pimeloyl-ACP methyl ester carboxylesterase
MTGLVIRALGVLLMLTAFAVSLSRAPDRPVQTLVARWALPPSDFIEVKGQVVHLRDEGPRQTGEDGPAPLVLIHGLSSSLHTWSAWARALKERRRVISFDLPGFGLTGPNSGSYPPDRYSTEADARFVLDLLDVLNVRRAVLVGHSLGGEVAWRVASMAPDRVAGLVLVDASGPPFTPMAVPLAFALARLPVVSRIGEWVLPRMLVEQGLASLYGNPARVTAEQVDRSFELALREGNRRALSLRLQQLRLGEGDEGIAALRLPTLILWGGLDHLIPPAVAEVFHRGIPGSRLVTFDDLGHMPQEEDPARSVAPVKAFLAGLAAGTAASAAAP